MMTLEELGKLYVEAVKNQERLVKENSELRKLTDPTPADHAAWRLRTYKELEDAAKKNVDAEIQNVLAQNDRLAKALETTEAEAQFCRQKWYEADSKRKNHDYKARQLLLALQGATKGIRRLRKYKAILRMFDLLRAGVGRGWTVNIEAPDHDPIFREEP